MIVTYWFIAKAIGGPKSRKVYREILDEAYNKKPARHYVMDGGTGVGLNYRGRRICGRDTTDDEYLNDT